MIKSWFANPLTRGIELNNPLTTAFRRQVILQNNFLVNIYSEWYKMIKNEMPDIPGKILEMDFGRQFMDKLMQVWNYLTLKGLKTIHSVVINLLSIFAFIHLEKHLGR